MANEELIYRITRAVYGRLGAQADERQVEQLVTDIYRAIEPVVTTNGGSASTASSTGMAQDEAAARGAGSPERLIVSVFGVDHPGIVAGVAQILAESECSIADINQTVVQGKFAMVIIADMARAGRSVPELKDRFPTARERPGGRLSAHTGEPR